MDERGVDAAEEKDSPHPLPFLEVTCRSSGKVWRFASGTEAGFAVHLINRRQPTCNAPVFHIEAVKEGEEPVHFGPKAALTHYGKGWKLNTSIKEAYEIGEHHKHSKISEDPYNGENQGEQLKVSITYIGKIILAFLFIFLQGGVFTFVLENLPKAMVLEKLPKAIVSIDSHSDL